MLGNSLGTWETYWEPIENSMDTHLELHGNALGTKKQSNNPTLSPTRKKKTWAAWGHAASPHWLKEMFLAYLCNLPFGGMNYGCILGMGPTPGTHHLAGSSSEGP